MSDLFTYLIMLLENILFYSFWYFRNYFGLPTPLKTPDFKGFYSSHFAIDSNMTAKNIEDALLFTAEHLFVRVC